MLDIWSKWIDALSGSFLQFGIRDVVDIALVAVVIYQLILLTKETRAVQVIKGLGALLFAQFLANVVGLSTISWILDQALRAGTIAFVVIFQPELRRALEKIGRGKFLSRRREVDANYLNKIANDCASALENMSKRQVGALVVFEGKTGLGEIIATGTRLDADISAALLEQIFEPNTPLHDGAAVLQKDRIIGAGCFLPLSETMSISRQLGTRHRAALGVSEISDCLAFIVSEESGAISLARNGELTRYVTYDYIVESIEALYAGEQAKQSWLYSMFIKGD